MSAHQVITGALNKGENVYSLGSVEGITFTVCAVGADVVILSADFSRVQIISGCSHHCEQLVTSVSCCGDSGKIAATYGSVVRVFEPASISSDRLKELGETFPFKWIETQCFTAKGFVSTILWNMDGLRMLMVIDDELVLYQHRSVGNCSRANSVAPVTFCIADDDQKRTCSWDIVWSTRLSQPPKYIKYSPDGLFFAVAGENDFIVKVFYEEMQDGKENLNFEFVTLYHPSPVRGFEWRRTGRYMPRKCVQAVIMTWSEDNTSRIWKETPSPELAIIDITGDGGEPAWEHNKPKKLFGKQFRVKKTRHKIMSKIRGLTPEKKRRTEEKELGIGLRAQIGLASSMTDLHVAHHAHANVQFHLAASINAESDCLLVPSMDTGSIMKKPFCVHWLNNKELVFSIGAEKLLTEALLSEGDSLQKAHAQGLISPNSRETTDIEENGHVSNGGAIDRPISVQGGSVCSESPSSKDILDVKLEILLRQWSKASDVLFTIHPVDGSLLVWTVEWLDDIHRQPVISFASRFPNAFPLTDATSLHPTVNTFNPHEPMYVEVLRNDDQREFVQERLATKRVSSTINMLTKHENGSLNLWHISMDENSNFSAILSITHISRMCGHRFQIRQAVAHPVLPLLLTTSQFRSDGTDHAPHDALSEVILWKISPVGPLCKSGGIAELARVASQSRVAYKSLAWIPAILPSCTLGTVCNSPSSCFISSDGTSLVIYQAVVDARDLLSEIYESKRFSEDDEVYNRSLTPSPRRIPNNLLQQLNVVSTQSTAKPGCVLEVGRTKNILPPGSHIHMLHVFNEGLLATDDEVAPRIGHVVDRSHTSSFRDKFYILMVVRQGSDEKFIMYSLVISSQELHSEDAIDENDPNFLRSSSPSHRSVARLHFQTSLVCEQEAPLPGGTEILSASPAAGHLSSSTLYPACKAPYMFLTSCSDDIVRCWVCHPSTENPGMFEWSEWNMVGNSRSSEVEVEGSILAISAAHSGRIACAYDPKSGLEVSKAPEVEIGVFECESSGGVEWMREDTLQIKHIRIPVNRESLVLSGALVHDESSDEKTISRVLAGSSDDLKVALGKIGPPSLETVAKKIRLDWVSTEDGGHILTVSVAASVYFYSQVSQDTAQQNVALMKESETSLRRPSLRKMSSLVGHISENSTLTRWVCTRILQLQSADGLPPVPTTLSWARDGLLIIGMQSEMRVYNQWNLCTKSPDSSDHQPAKRPSVQVTLPISASHSLLDQLHKKKDLTTSKSKMRLDIASKSAVKESTSHTIIETNAAEGLFEAARFSSPILPQYHPKQLIVLLNAGKTKRVKAILLHVLNALKQHQVTVHNPLSRAASMRRMSTVDSGDEKLGDSTIRSINLEEDSPDYDEIDDIAPLPLFALIAADATEAIGTREKAEEFGRTPASTGYDSLFDSNNVDDDDLDDLLKENESGGGRSRHHSTSSDVRADIGFSVTFTAKHNRALTELLTHTHLPGLSSVDQMHLLAIADTLSHFSSDVMDKLTQANAALQPVPLSILGDSLAGGYATAAAGVETVDECGLRFLMAMKQHEYLLICLPPKQRIELRKRGLSTAHIIWAQHSETESELLNAVPFMQKDNPTWEDFRSLGIAWWLKNNSSLRICMEKLAKAAFQQNQDPMDAALFYLSMKKKSVLPHLFRTSRNEAMASFFSNDFATSEHWRKVAAKNAFVLMSKQRFQHAAALFLLSGSLKDAVQTILRNCMDLQLAMVVIRLFETDPDVQQGLLKEILCREVLGMSSSDFDAIREGKADDEVFISRGAKSDPFERSMAYWYLKDYARAAHTLVEEAHGGRLHFGNILSDIFNFYSFLRKHPLVIRQRLTDAGIQIGSTEKFIAIGRKLESIVTAAERRLFFRTAAEHMAHGCPMLALEVLSRLPHNMLLVTDSNEYVKRLLSGSKETSIIEAKKETAAEFDWSQPTDVVERDELELTWSDDEDNEDAAAEEETNEVLRDTPIPDDPARSPTSSNQDSSNGLNEGSADVIAQHLKFVASIRILTEELSTLASGFEVDGGQLRYQLFTWLEKEVDALGLLCDYRTIVENDEAEDESDFVQNCSPLPSLTDALRSDHAELVTRLKITSKRRKWLVANQKLLRSFTSFCILHSAQNHRLTSALMELLLLLLEVQRDTGVQHLSETVPQMNSFPLLEASLSSTKMFVSSPLSFIENQCQDLLFSIANMTAVPSPEHGLQKAYILYNLSQGLSACLYQSLCDVDHFNVPIIFSNTGKPGALTKRPRCYSSADDIKITTAPGKWPGVESLIALLGREKDDDGPHLRLLLAECFVAITMSLFCFALAAHDSRWLYRLSAHSINQSEFGLIFGGGGTKNLVAVPPARPPRPSAPRTSRGSESRDRSESGPDANALRSRLHTKVLGSEKVVQQTSGSPVLQQTVCKWVPPHKNIVQLFAEKPAINTEDSLGVAFDSDDEEEQEIDEDEEDQLSCESARVTSYAWELMRLALIEQQAHRLKEFLHLSGFDPSDIASSAPRLDSILRLLSLWSSQARDVLRTYPGGCPVDIIPNTSLDTSEATACMKKYACLLEPNNTPFESDDVKILPIKRLWSFLVHETHLQFHFVAHLFANQGVQEQVPIQNDTLCGNIENQPMPAAFRIAQKDSEHIVAFACNQDKPGLIVVSNGRGLQELDLSNVFEESTNPSSWIYNRTELDVQLMNMKADPLKDNDDYQLFTDNPTQANIAKQANVTITPWIIDRSRRGLGKLFKRTVNGIRRIDSHPTAPFYVTGSTDGSIRVWEWGVGQPVYTARVAGQHAKVTKITFSCNGNKFAAVDGDGMLCLWQACHSTDQKKPFFSQRCHNKSAADVRFLGYSSSVLLTAGYSTGDYNLGLWDTLLPQNRALVHSWIAHPEGATCAMYLQNQQTIVSGGKHGEISLWDVRQRQLRATMKAFEPHQIVKTIVSDFSQDLIVAGSSEGDIKIWSADMSPQLMYALNGEHAARSGFSFRQVGQSSIQGVQQLYVDQHMRLFSCGADATLKFRTLPSVYNMNLDLSSSVSSIR